MHATSAGSFSGTASCRASDPAEDQREQPQEPERHGELDDRQVRVGGLVAVPERRPDHHEELQELRDEEQHRHRHEPPRVALGLSRHQEQERHDELQRRQEQQVRQPAVLARRRK